MTIALGLVPIEQFQYFLDWILYYCYGDIYINNFYHNYFAKTWLLPSIPLSLINWYGVTYRTNNNAEAHNSVLAKRFICDHPKFYRFLSVLEEYHSAKMYDLRQIELGLPPPPKNVKYQKLNLKITEIQENVENYHPIDYLRALAHSTPVPTFNM